MKNSVRARVVKNMEMTAMIDHNTFSTSKHKCRAATAFKVKKRCRNVEKELNVALQNSRMQC